jgi:hypothetical protein
MLRSGRDLVGGAAVRGNVPRLAGSVDHEDTRTVIANLTVAHEGRQASREEVRSVGGDDRNGPDFSRSPPRAPPCRILH